MRREEWKDLYRAVPVLWPIDPGPFFGAEVGAVLAGNAGVRGYCPPAFADRADGHTL